MKEKFIHVGVKRTDIGCHTIIAKKRKFKNSVPVEQDKLIGTTFQISHSLNTPVQIKIYK